MKKSLPILSILILAALLLAACGANTTAQNTPVQEENAVVEESTAPVEEQAPTEAEAEEPEAMAHEWPAPIEEEPAFSQRPPTEDELAAGDALANQSYAIPDFLYQAFTHGRTDEVLDLVSATEASPKTVGVTQEFWVNNIDKDTWSQVEMKLVAVSDHAYFWVDLDRESDPEKIQAAVDAFENIYEQDRAIFGSEDIPGVDGDPHIYILHPAATKLCNVDESTAHQCGILGYFWSLNEYPAALFPNSNVFEGLIMNYDGDIIGGQGYSDTLAHEFRHLIEFWYDEQGETWEVEGSAVMAEDLLGFSDAPDTFASYFLSNPDLQLNGWADGQASIPHYGKGYLINRYIYNRFGPDFYSKWEQDPSGGLSGLTQVLGANGYDLTGLQVWLDFLASLVLFDDPSAPPEYTLGEGGKFDEVASTLAAGLPRTYEEEVHQFGSDIYRIKSEADVNVTFSGTTLVSLLSALPTSASHFWYSGRAAGAFPTLTLEADLSGVDSATLEFDTYYKYTKAFGFGYVTVSTDGGETWSGLVSENMRGDKVSDDPYDLALTERFFTGVAPGAAWTHETIDLSEYAGQVIQIRFESDGNDQSPGFAIDNVAIPEIDFYDDAESEVAGWTAEGWNRVTAYIPQTFELILITFEDGVPVVQNIEVGEGNTVSFDVTGLTADNNIAYVIVAGTAPHTEATAAYVLDIIEK